MKKKLLVLVMAFASVAALTGCEKKEDKKEEGTTTTVATPSKLTCVLTEDKDRTTLYYYFKEGSVYKTSYQSSTHQKDEKTAKKQKLSF